MSKGLQPIHPCILSIYAIHRVPNRSIISLFILLTSSNNCRVSIKIFLLSFLIYIPQNDLIFIKKVFSINIFDNNKVPIGVTLLHSLTFQPRYNFLKAPKALFHLKSL